LEATGEAFLEEVDREIGVPAVEWDSVVEGYGQGFPATDAVSEEQRRMTALRAARYVALGDLLGKIGGTRVRQESKVLNMQFAGEAVEVERAGMLEGVQVVRSEYDPERQIASVTVRVGLDKEGKIIPERLLPITPLSLEARRARAEHAARVQALVALREQIGQIRVGQSIKVKNLVLSRQEASLVVEGMLEGAEFSEPEWPTPRHCKVKASLTLSEADLARLRKMGTGH